ncbi:hypothetical protein SEPCBS119000_005410 [Sporothrix epigloea]|uniref:Uncharacterized protein n=1 Tax=Sporothrix epigloea TaxID=1892477 RepID=A0ABP0DZQ2_9PEZI
MGSVAHAHLAHQSHNSHHYSHRSATLAEYERDRHVSSSSQVLVSSITEAGRKRANLSETQASLHLAPMSGNHRVHDRSRHHIRESRHAHIERAASHGQGLSVAKSAQHRTGYATQPSGVGRLTSVSAFLTPPTTDSERPNEMASQNFSSGLSPIQATSSSVSSHAAAPSARNTVNGTNQQTTMLITEKDSLAMVIHSPEVPRCISPNGGSITDFTAEMACLFWFELPSAYLPSEHDEDRSPTALIPRLSDNAIPSVNFRSWVSRIINTTQVTQNVILLALLFIFRLKSLNVVVRGKSGSEFRLLTVALMLGNKFLDDNTYTNKTWSDVSGINVKEIHVMEVEFLSNMRYGLLVSKEEWESWLAKLARFRRYYERALSSTVLARVNLSPPRLLATPLSSPTAYNYPSSANPANLSPVSSVGGYTMPLYSPTTSRPLFAPVTAPIQLPAWPGKLPTPHEDAVTQRGGGAAKRSISSEDITEPLPKRSSRFIASGTTLPQPITAQTGGLPSIGSTGPMSSGYGPSTRKPSPGLAATAEARRLPAPNLMLNTTATQLHTSAQLGTPGTNAHTQYPLNTAMPQQLQQTVPQHAGPVTHAQMPMTLPPPLSLGVRAMSTVYPSTSTSNAALTMPPLLTPTTFAIQSSVLPTSGPATSAATTAPVAGNSTTLYSNQQTFGTPTKRLSPIHAITPSTSSMYTAAAVNSSPLAESFPHMAGSIHTPLAHSPSVYLQQRFSPYRPIRNVHMLLNPPPTSSLHDYQSLGPILIPPTQMYYNPLGRPNDLRSGIVPEFQGVQLPYRHNLSRTPTHALQQPVLQTPARDAHAQRPQQQAQQQQLLTNTEPYAHQQLHYKI